MGIKTPVVPEATSVPTHGLAPERIWANLGAPALYEHAARRGEGLLTASGAMAVVTTPHTGRSPKDKFLVDEPTSSPHIWWEKNERFAADSFDRLLEDLQRHLNGQELFVQDLFG